ncbi:hypothetical protein CXF97_24275 [Pseudomonas sp. Choline-02u-1]|nr:hypothetical protein CXF97_24275 [Pseudomonas sp. Choline-02u-1]
MVADQAYRCSRYRLYGGCAWENLLSRAICRVRLPGLAHLRTVATLFACKRTVVAPYLQTEIRPCSK